MTNPLTDEYIVSLYWDRDDEAIGCSDRKYGAYCYEIAKNILNNVEDSEECVNDTWMKAWNTIPPLRPVILRAFFARLVRNLALDRYRSRHTKKRGDGQVDLCLHELEACVSSKGGPEDMVVAKELSTAISAFLKTLPVRDRALFIRRYFFAEDYPALAEHFQLKESNVRKIISRSRDKLRVYLAKQGF